MAAVTILRLPRVDEQDAFAVLRVEKTASTGILRLTGTEGEAPYVGSVEPHESNHLRARGSSASDQEWEAILQHVLAPEGLPDHPAIDPVGLEAVSSIEGEKLQVFVRRNVKGIAQNLGIIHLQREEDEEIDVVEWAAVAAASASQALAETAALRKNLQNQTDTIRKLTEQLDALTEAKKKHDAQLLEKFSKLLNSKKLKIREQQRILATAQPDRSKVIPAQAHQQEAQNSSSRTTRLSKRKANGKAKVESGSDSDQFEAGTGPAASKVKEEEETDEEMATVATPEQTDDDTDDEGEAGAPPAQIPPRRVLPFGKPSAPAKPAATAVTAPAAAPAASEPDEDETDDEL